MHDVIVIGGGPVGSRVAYKLAATGYDVVVLEKEASPGHKTCCTGIVGQECIDAFDVGQNLIMNRANSARLFSPSGKMVRIWREKPQAFILDRAAFDVSMVNQAKDKGAKYQFNTRAEVITFSMDKVKVMALYSQEITPFAAKTVVMAAGFGSRLPEKAGLGKITNFAMGVQAEVETAGVDEVEIYFGRGIAPEFFAWLVPASPGKGRVGLISRQNSGQYLRELIASLVAQGKIISADVELSYGGVPLRSLPKTYGDRIIVVGDAAGQVKPLTGGGIYYGLLCADIAADTLHKAIQSGDFSARSLSRYHREWHRKLGQELRIGYYARAMYERLSDRQIDGLFEAVERRGIDKVLARADDLSFDWHGRVILRLGRLLGLRLAPIALQMVKSRF